MSTHPGSLYEFMPYGAPELKEVARKYMVRAVLLGCAMWVVMFLLSFGTTALLALTRPASWWCRTASCRRRHL